jgi:nitroreductase
MAAVERRQSLTGQDFYRICGLRRSVRWFKTWKPVEREKIQRILEVVRIAGSSPGNLQPWRAVVVEQAKIPAEKRERLLYADNMQAPHALAPVWIYWFGDMTVVRPEIFKQRLSEMLEAGSAPTSHGWSREVMEAIIDRGEEAPEGLPALHEIAYGMAPEFPAQAAYSETVGAAVIGLLAAINEGLGTTLCMAAAPSKAHIVREELGVPDTWLPVWMQLIGYPAEDVETGGQRPRLPFEEIFFYGDARTRFERDPAVVCELEQAGLLGAPAPVAGRFEELKRLAQMFGYPI